MTDESCFTRDGAVNFHNSHVWAEENPRAFRQCRYQQRFSLNMWAGIVNNTLIGPYELPTRLNGNTYLQFLQEVLPGLLEEVPLNVRRELWFLHDGCPAHFDRAVRNHLDNTFPRRWIGRGGPVPWPPRSPDLNPLDFFLWGFLKERVYTTEVENIDELRHRIYVASEELRQQFPRLAGNWIRRAHTCLEVQGQHFEHLL